MDRRITARPLVGIAVTVDVANVMRCEAFSTTPA